MRIKSIANVFKENIWAFSGLFGDVSYLFCVHWYVATDRFTMFKKMIRNWKEEGEPYSGLCHIPLDKVCRPARIE